MANYKWFWLKMRQTRDQICSQLGKFPKKIQRPCGFQYVFNSLNKSGSLRPCDFGIENSLLKWLGGTGNRFDTTFQIQCRTCSWPNFIKIVSWKSLRALQFNGWNIRPRCFFHCLPGLSFETPGLQMLLSVLEIDVEVGHQRFGHLAAQQDVAVGFEPCV